MTCELRITGTIKGDSYVLNGETKERVGGVFNVVGKPAGSALSEAYAGDIVAITKFKTVKTGDTISEDKKPFDYAAPEVPPALFARVQEGLRKHCPDMIQQFSTGGRGRDPPCCQRVA